MVPVRAEALSEACDLCGTGMVYVHCRYRCTTCGFLRDCSDP
jgi:hypothetical protein